MLKQGDGYVRRTHNRVEGVFTDSIQDDFSVEITYNLLNTIGILDSIVILIN